MANDYLKSQLERVKPGYGDIITVKFIGDGETNWLNITPVQYQAIKDALLKPAVVVESEGGDHD